MATSAEVEEVMFGVSLIQPHTSDHGHIGLLTLVPHTSPRKNAPSHQIIWQMLPIVINSPIGVLTSGMTLIRSPRVTTDKGEGMTERRMLISWTDVMAPLLLRLHLKEPLPQNGTLEPSILLLI